MENCVYLSNMNAMFHTGIAHLINKIPQSSFYKHYHWNRVLRWFPQRYVIADQLHFDMLIKFGLILKFQPPNRWGVGMSSRLQVYINKVIFKRCKTDCSAGKKKISHDLKFLDEVICNFGFPHLQLLEIYVCWKIMH